LAGPVGVPRRDGDGWRGMVRYRVDLSQYLQWRDQSELRRAAQRESATAAARLDETVAEVEAARAAGRTDW
jgi:hypothetical protein